MNESRGKEYINNRRHEQNIETKEQVGKKKQKEKGINQ
jgi:hypothetical protein